MLGAAVAHARSGDHVRCLGVSNGNNRSTCAHSAVPCTAEWGLSTCVRNEIDVRHLQRLLRRTHS